MENKYLCVKLPEIFNLDLSLDCGQAFRWKKNGDGFMCGVIGNRAYMLKQDGNKLICDCSADEFNSILAPYLGLDEDYKNLLSRFASDEKLKNACTEFSGIRILRQEPWEALCSFIISQNNNIPRIKGIVERLCENFGEDLGHGNFSFPSYEILADRTVEDLAPLRSGFRAKYIIDAAQKVKSGEVDFISIQNNDIQFGRDELIKIKGVGKKVAECTLLYGFHKLEAFPEDVWVKRIMAELYPDGLPECTRGYEGVAQQYLFHWRRNSAVFN